MIRAQTKDLTLEVGMKKLTKIIHLLRKWFGETRLHIGSKGEKKKYPGSLFGLTTSGIDKKELIERLARDTIYTDRVECFMRRNEAAA